MAQFDAALGETRFRLEEEGLGIEIFAKGTRWVMEKDPYFLLEDGTKVLFSSAGKISHEPWSTGLGKGICSRFEGFRVGERSYAFSFCTVVWLEESTGDLICQWIPLNEDRDLQIQAVYWPSAMEFDELSSQWYSLLNLRQGMLVPNTWETELTKLPFQGQLCSCAAYMPWFGQVRPGAGYLAVSETPWDGAYQCCHPAGGAVRLSYRWLPSLGAMSYPRTVRYRFFGDCDYNHLCKAYRSYVKETGLFTSLEQKAAQNPNVNRLIGAAFVHQCAKSHVEPTSEFYDPEHLKKNDALVTFRQRAEQLEEYHQLGVENIYYHLDGWGQPGYDNQHPDYLPACQEAGGWDGLRELAQTAERCGYLFGLHDQYRDYYFNAKTFDPEFGLYDARGKMFEMCRWAGGRQTYLCATQAPGYVKRNFEQVLAHGIPLHGSYLDVFTCNEPDECSHPMHRMTRRECLGYRAQCFAYLTAKGILPSSEEVNDWAMKEQVFCHYGPYDFMLEKPGTPRQGIPVPLFNLVYHDCMVLPWPMDRLEGQEDFMLYALLNGGAPYLDKEGAYPGVDGAFGDPDWEGKKQEAVDRCRIVTQLHKQVGKQEMLSHRVLDQDGSRQQTRFADGTVVTIDLKANTYQIEREP